MNEATQINIGLAVLLGGAIIAAILALLGYINSQVKEVKELIDQERTWREEAIEANKKEWMQAVRGVETSYSLSYREFLAYKNEAILMFATPGAIEKSEERLTVSMDRLGTRVETMIGKMENLTIQMTRIANGQTKASNT